MEANSCIFITVLIIYCRFLFIYIRLVRTNKASSSVKISGYIDKIGLNFIDFRKDVILANSLWLKKKTNLKPVKLDDLINIQP